MESGFSKMDQEIHPRLLDLISKERKWSDADHNFEGSRKSVSDDKKLELRLGPPGLEDWSHSDAHKHHKSTQKRSAPAPVVGWPPIRSFRKNIAGTSSAKPPLSASNTLPNNNVVKRENMEQSCQKGYFVKINMDGVPIGRKVDLKAYDSYEKLSVAVDELFRGLLAAQRDTSGGGHQSNQETERAISGLLDGSGEYTLVYEDNEGDRMLVGDVPWHMFVSTVKRLRVLKSSELSKLCLGSKQEKIRL